MPRADEVRSRIEATIHRYPGIHLRGIAEELGISSALANYHVRALAEAGRVLAWPTRKRTRYAPPGFPQETLETLAILREPTPLRIVLALLQHGSMRHAELAHRLDLPLATLSYHLRILQRQGFLQQPPDHRIALQQPNRMQAILREHPPSPALRGEIGSSLKRALAAPPALHVATATLNERSKIVKPPTGNE